MPKLGVGELQAILSQGFPDSDVPHVEEVTDDSVIVSYAVTDRHGRPGGTLAGPVMMSLADTSAWSAMTASQLPSIDAAPARNSRRKRGWRSTARRRGKNESSRRAWRSGHACRAGTSWAGDSP